MQEVFLKILIICYGATAVANIVAYWPTIKDLYFNKKPSANIASYFIWTISTGIAFLYAIFILPDMLFIIVSGTFFVSNAIVLYLSIKLKNKL
jgi:hypothetical protein